MRRFIAVAGTIAISDQSCNGAFTPHDCVAQCNASIKKHITSGLKKSFNDYRIYKSINDYRIIFDK